MQRRGLHGERQEGGRLSVRLATAEDVWAFFGARPPQTVRAVTVLLDGKPGALGGVALETGWRKFFTEFKPEFEPFLGTVTCWRAVKLAATFIRSPTYAVCSLEGEKFLPRLGFRQIGGDLWRA